MQSRRGRFIEAVCIAVLIVSMALVWALTSNAQSPYPVTTIPQVPVGGYVVPQPVPYQPTLTAQVPVLVPQGPAAWIGPPGAGPPVVEQSVLPVNPAPTGLGPWQTLPAAGVPLPGDNMLPAPGGVAVPGAVVAPPPAFPAEPSPGGPPSILPPGARNGVFQKINFDATYLPRFGDDSLGMTDLEAQIVFGVPFFTVQSPLVITPKFGYHLLDGPDSPDVPPHVEDVALDLEHIRPFGDRWIGLFDLTLGEFADDHSFDTGDAFRITGSGTAVYVFSPELKAVLGLAYVNRAQEQFLPIVGVDYKQSDDAEYQLVFPSTKLSWRLPSSPIPGQDEHWFYVKGDFGGGVWAVQRTSGAEDRLDITDWRISMGLEHKVIGGLSEHVELGYVFHRRLEYFSNHDEVSLGDTLLLRAGVTY
jgi:hypothetical protein